MNDRLSRALETRRPDRIPFLPAVYEHKAWFIGSTPSQTSRDESRLVESVLAEYEILRPDALVVGIDVYNVEAEAAGCGVTAYEGVDTSIPALTPGMEALAGGRRVADLRTPDPRRDARMPLMLRATESVHRKLGRIVPVYGAVTGPFSLAAALMGPANLFMAMASEPEIAREAVEFSAGIILRYGSEFARRGLAVTMFDSQASPGLISPRSYSDFVLRPTQRVITELLRCGMKHVPLVIGGNTDGILDSYVASGGNYLLCDADASVTAFLRKCRPSGRAFRRNLSSAFQTTESPGAIRRIVHADVLAAEGYPGFIMGTGVIPYGTATARILAVREALEETPIPASA
jgi:uroporphyrinogen decarboxylase